MRIITLFILLTGVLACKKEFINPDITPPVLSLDSLDGPNYNATTNNLSAQAFARVVKLGNTNLIERGFLSDDTLALPTIDDNDRKQRVSSVGVGAFNLNLAGLPPARTVYFRAYAVYFNSVAYSNVLSLVTPKTRPVLILNRPVGNDITANSVKLSGTLVFTGGEAVTEQGFVLGTASNPTIADIRIDAGDFREGAAYSAEATNLVPGTTYFLRAFAVNSLGITYTPQVSFTTKTE
jgi:hypothetical protein